MGTLSFHIDSELEKRIRAVARKRKMPLSRFLKESVERSLEDSFIKGKDIRGIISGKSHLQPEDTALLPWNDTDLFP